MPADLYDILTLATAHGWAPEDNEQVDYLDVVAFADALDGDE